MSKSEYKNHTLSYGSHLVPFQFSINIKGAVMKFYKSTVIGWIMELITDKVELFELGNHQLTAQQIKYRITKFFNKRFNNGTKRETTQTALSEALYVST